MTNAAYWKNRWLKEREQLLDLRIDATAETLKWQYRRLSDRTIKDLLEVYNKIMTNPNATKNDIYRYNRFYALSADIQNRLHNLGEEQTDLLSGEMLELYKQTTEIVGKEFDINILFNEDRAKDVINSIWVADGKNWSQRIWQNNETLSAFLQTGLIDSLGAGYNPDNLKKALMKAFNTSYYNADRIVRTEYTHIAVTAAVEGYQKAGVEEYQWLTAKDCRLCRDCKDLDGKRYPVTDYEHLPVKHPNCRCTIIAVLPEKQPTIEETSPKSLLEWYESKNRKKV